MSNLDQPFRQDAYVQRESHLLRPRSLDSSLTLTSPQVTLKENASPDELTKAKDKAKAEGGEIKHEFTLIKGFTVEFPDDKVGVLKTNEHVNVEMDGEVKTQ